MNTTQYSLLIVDDDDFIREILEAMLAGAGYKVEMAVDGEDAWAMLDSGQYHFSAVLLDRNMPRLDGMGLLARMKADKRFVDLPVIFQTATDHPLEIAEGIKAGAFYYLVKPVNETVLFAIVQSAVNTFSQIHKVNKQEKEEAADLSKVLQRCEFKLHTLLEARSLANALASFFPQPERAFLGILELLINAVEHGNLAISYTEKSKLLQQGKWEDEILHRLSLPEYIDKNVQVLLENNAQGIMLKISDDGEGFDCRKYLELSPERAFDPNGRGIAMSRMMSFDSVEYQGKGNQVVAFVKI